MRRYVYMILGLPLLLCIILFAISAAVNGIDEAFKLSLEGPRKLFCSVIDVCDDDSMGTEVVSVTEIWTRIHERALLDVGKYETRKDWRAEISTWPVTHSMGMRATTSITLALNLGNILPEDIVVDEENKTITVTLPQVQPAECFLSEIEFHSESCLLVCDDLKKDLQEKAIEDVLDSDGLEVELVAAYERAKPIIGGLISPVARDYVINFVQRPEAPNPIESGSCN